MHYEVAMAAAGALALAAVHVLTPPLVRLPHYHQAHLASFSGGAGLAYVTLYLLYELVTDGAAKIHTVLPIGPEPVETLFIVLLFALSVNYVIQMQLQKTPDKRDDHHGLGFLFIAYNFLVGGGLPEEARWGALNLTFYVTALGLHMLFNDLFLHHVCPPAHTWRWRLGLAASPLIGFGAVVLFGAPEGLLYAVLAYVAGGTIINVLRFELPGLPDFRWPAFVSGITIYAALILGAWRF